MKGMAACLYQARGDASTRQVLQVPLEAVREFPPGGSWHRHAINPFQLLSGHHISRSADGHAVLLPVTPETAEAVWGWGVVPVDR